MSGLIEHLESHLGPIVSGWSKDADGAKLPFQVVLFEGGPISGVKTLTTLGLSNTALRIGDGSQKVQQELLMMLRAPDAPQNFPGVIQQLGMEALSKDRAYMRGQVLGPRGQLRPNATVSAFFVASPVYLPDSFHIYRGADERVVFAWLAPITAEEARFIGVHGPDAFEDALMTSDPDLLDLERAGIV